MSKVVECIKLKDNITIGHYCIIRWFKTLNIDEEPKEMRKKQAIAAVGQGKLIAR